jgi:hypothetical protein
MKVVRAVVKRGNIWDTREHERGQRDHNRAFVVLLTVMKQTDLPII